MPDTIFDEEKLRNIQCVIRSRIVESFFCEEEVNYVMDDPVKGVMSFYIFREGGLKRSMQRRLISELETLKRYWIPMIGYDILTVGE